MANKMLIDATHPEETRVVVLRGNRVEEFDFESAHRKQLRGNIYLAKVTRVEPSLQAAFVDYGGNRHGFLAFSEIHPDYYQIPVADRQALIDEESRATRAADEEVDHRARGGRRRPRRRNAHRRDDTVRSEPLAVEETAREADETAAGDAAIDQPTPGEIVADAAPMSAAEPPAAEPATEEEGREAAEAPAGDASQVVAETPSVQPTDADVASEAGAEAQAAEHETGNGEDGNGEEEVVESVGGADALEEVPERPFRPRRQYKIQEVIKRRQVLLVQVVKEERGTKGAALTTYLSLAGRYSVLMPNTARGGGISRKITDSGDRKRLKDIAQELEVPEGMGVILRTAGASRTKTEVKRDFEYLLRMWETVRDLTLKSTAPKLVYEEGSLTKRSIRDLYNKDIDEIIVAGEDGYKDAKEFMRMLMPSHAKNVKLYKDALPLFSRYGIENQLDAMFQPTVQLKSGGYIVLNQAEALVAIDVNSGRATREHHIEDTALKTNLEAAEEIARQLRLRDLAGLIVIDFIDMDENRNNRSVERRLKDCLKHDRARIQVGRISHFGLLEMSRQRIRTSVLESSTEKCPVCGGSGHVRSVSSVALQLLRALEDALNKGATHNLIVRTRSEVAIYVLNNKRAHLRELEQRFRITITITTDATVPVHLAFVIDRGEQVHSPEAARALVAQAASAVAEPEEAEEEIAAEAAEDETEAAEISGEERGEGRGRRRRRRGRRGGEGREPSAFTHETVAEHAVAHEDDFEAAAGDAEAEPLAGAGRPVTGDVNGERRRRRRGRRGGRRRRGREGEIATSSSGGADLPVEPEVGRAVADLDTTPAAPEPLEPAYEAPAVTAPSPEPPPEPPRKRSTVREPAPIFGSGEAPPSPPAPAAAPIPAETAAAEPSDDNQPRRTGWWARRMAGGN